LNIIARLFTVAISEANYNNTDQQIWLLNNISSRINSLTTVSHSVSNDTYSGYSGMIELLVQVLDASAFKGYPSQYREVRQALTALLTKYESDMPQEVIEEARKSYGNKYSEFETELEKIEEELNTDGHLEDRSAFYFFHREGKRESTLRRAKRRQCRAEDMK
jgi:hypothetical protein